MVYKKQLAKRPLTFFDQTVSSTSSESTSESQFGFTYIEFFWGTIMAKKSSKRPGKLKLSEAPTLVLPPGETLSTPNGDWRDIEYLFVQKDDTVPGSFYYRDLTPYFKNRLPGSAIAIYLIR